MVTATIARRHGERAFIKDRHDTPESFAKQVDAIEEQVRKYGEYILREALSVLRRLKTSSVYKLTDKDITFLREEIYARLDRNDELFRDGQGQDQEVEADPTDACDRCNVGGIYRLRTDTFVCPKCKKEWVPV